MIVLYGGETASGGGSGFSGVLIVDDAPASVAIEANLEDGTTIQLTAGDENPGVTFTATPSKTAQDLKFTVRIQADGADDLTVDLAKFVAMSETMLPPSLVTGPLPKEELVEVVTDISSSFSFSGSTMSANAFNTPITCGISRVENDIVATNNVNITNVSPGVFDMEITLAGSELISMGDVSYFSSVDIDLAVTVGSETTVADPISLDIKNLIFLPSVTNNTNQYLYSMEGAFRMTGGWATDNILPMSKHLVFKQDIDPVTCCFRNKYYAKVDPAAFSGSIVKNVFTSAKVGELFTLMNTVSDARSYPINVPATPCNYESGSQSGTVEFEIIDGLMEVDTEFAESNDGFAIFTFTFDDSVYVNQFLYMPCVVDQAVPKAVALDGKTVYDQYVGAHEVGLQVTPGIMSGRSFFTFIASYIWSLAYGAIFRAMDDIIWLFYTRGLGCGLLSSNLEMAIQIVLQNEHTKYVSTSGGGIAHQVGAMMRSHGYVLSRTLRGLSKVQQDYVMGELLTVLEGAIGHSRPKPGMFAWVFCGVPMVMNYTYTDGFLLGYSGMGSFWDSNLQDIHDGGNLPDDEVKAAVRKHTMFSYCHTIVDVGGRNTYSFASIDGAISRVSMNGRINEIGGINGEADFQLGKDWSGQANGSDRTTVHGEVTYMMTRTKTDRFSRFNMNNLKDGITPAQLQTNWAPTGSGGTSIGPSGRGKGRSFLLDIELGILYHSDGSQENVEILKPNSNIIIAI